MGEYLKMYVKRSKMMRGLSVKKPFFLWVSWEVLEQFFWKRK
jgi:hypothetical protein